MMVLSSHQCANYVVFDNDEQYVQLEEYMIDPLPEIDQLNPYVITLKCKACNKKVRLRNCHEFIDDIRMISMIFCSDVCKTKYKVAIEL